MNQEKPQCELHSYSSKSNYPPDSKLRDIKHIKFGDEVNVVKIGRLNKVIDLG